MVVTCTTDFSGMQIDVGDVVDLTNADYGFTAKEFRVMKHEEQLDDNGMITCAITLLEYNDAVYVQPAVTDSALQLPIDIPTIPIIPIVIPGVFDGTYGNVTVNQGSYGNVVVNDTMKTFGAGTQLVDNPAANTSVTSGTGTFLDIIPEESYDISGADIGDYELSASATLGGTVLGAYDVGFRSAVTLEFANATNTLVQPILGNSGPILGFDAAPPPLISNTKVSLDPTSYAGGSADMKPTRANIKLQGFTDVGTSNAAPRSFANMGYEFLRVTKGEK